MVGGATLTKLLGTSAWYAPGAAAAYVVESIIRDQKKVIVSCTALDGEYGQKDICIGVPAVIGKNGVEKILQAGAVAILSLEENKGKIAYFGGINKCKFKGKIIPGDKVRLETKIIRRKGPVGVGEAVASVDGKVVVSAELTFMVG